MEEKTELDTIKEEVLQETKKSVLKAALKTVISKSINSLVLGLISACSKLAEKANVKKDGETKWYMVLLWTILAVVLGAAATFGTQYSTEISQYFTDMLSFLN